MQTPPELAPDAKPTSTPTPETLDLGSEFDAVHARIDQIDAHLVALRKSLAMLIPPLVQLAEVSRTDENEAMRKLINVQGAILRKAMSVPNMSREARQQMATYLSGLSEWNELEALQSVVVGRGEPQKAFQKAAETVEPLERAAAEDEFEDDDPELG